MEFSHVGMISDRPREGEVFVEATRVWITDFVKHPLHVEWLRVGFYQSADGAVIEFMEYEGSPF